MRDAIRRRTPGKRNTVILLALASVVTISVVAIMLVTIGFLDPYSQRTQCFAALEAQASEWITRWDAFNANGSFGSCRSKRDDEAIVVVLWDVGSWTGFGAETAPHYLTGPDVILRKTACSKPCLFTKDRNLLDVADAILTEPRTASNFDTVRSELPLKRPCQQLGLVHFETPLYYHILQLASYTAVADFNMTWQGDSLVHTTFLCPWGGHSVSEVFAPSPWQTRQQFNRMAGRRGSLGLAMFIAYNCRSRGAKMRTQFIKELMKHIPVDSYGPCLHTKDFPRDIPSRGRRSWVGTTLGEMMSAKIALMKRYKFTLAFENAAIPDYVTEKLPTALMAGTVPVYLGAPNVAEAGYTPGNHSIINAADFESAGDLANYLKYLDANDSAFLEYFAWKNESVRKEFIDRANECVFFSECRLCDKLRERPTQCTIGPLAPEAAVQLDAVAGDVLSTPRVHLPLSSLRQGTVAAWVRLPNTTFISPQRIRRIGIAALVVADNATVSTWSTSPHAALWAVHAVFDHSANWRLQFCAGGRCAITRYGVVSTGDTWHHLAVVFRVCSSERGRPVVSMRLLLDGVEEFHSLAVDGFAAADGVTVVLGATSRSDWTGPQSLPYALDDVSWWDVPLPCNAVYKFRYGKLAGREPGLRAYWSFDGSAEIPLVDAVSGIALRPHGAVVKQTQHPPAKPYPDFLREEEMQKRRKNTWWRRGPVRWWNAAVERVAAPGVVLMLATAFILGALVVVACRRRRVRRRMALFH